jgi:hypothetical protein
MPFLRDIGGFIGDNLPGAINVVSPLLSGLADIGLSAVELALKAIATTWETYLKPAFEAIGGWLSDLTGGWDNLARGAEVLKGTMTDIASAIRDIAAGKVDFSQIFSGLGELGNLLGLGGGGGSAPTTPPAPVSLMGDANNDGKLSRGEHQNLLRLIGKPGGPSSLEEWKALPHFAAGVRNFRGGLALLGENGPELAALAAGSNVYNAGDTARMLGAGGGGGGAGGGAGGLTINVTVQGSVIEERGLAQKIREQLIDLQRYNYTSNIR